MNSAKSMRGSANKFPSLSSAARQMGLSAEDLGPEAEEYWKKLTEMADKDPDEYRKFVEKQIKEAKEEDKPKKGFRPKAGMSVKTKYTNGGKGEVTLNLCSFQGIEPPVDAAGEPVQGEAKTNLAGLNIPLAVSPLREVPNDDGDGITFVVDAVFHPWVLKQMGEFSSFRSQVIELALTFAEQELRGRLDRKYVVLASAYTGYEKTLTGKVEAFFKVESPEDEREEKGQAEQVKADHGIQASVLKQPTDLLSALRENNDKLDASQPEIILEKKLPANESKKNLVQEIKPKKTTEPVKKGFLHKAMDKESGLGLYPEGTSEGKATSMYQKSKIVDLNKLSAEQVQSIMMEHAGPQQGEKPPQQPPKVPADNFDNVTKDILQDALKGLSKQEKDVFAKLAEAADEELASLNVGDSKQVQGQLEGLFGDMAKVLGSFSIASKPIPENEDPGRQVEVAQASEQVDSTIGDAHSLPQPSFSIAQSESDGTLTVKVQLPLVSSMMEVDVDISERKIRLAASKHYAEVDIRLPGKISKDSARAKFSSKTKALTIVAKVSKP